MSRSAMDFGLVASGLVKATLPKVAGAIATAVKNKLHPTELQRSLTVALQKSGAFDRGQKVNNAVFYRCTDKDADTFLAALLEHPDVQRELQKPLEQDGAPDVAILVQVAKHIAADRAFDIPDETLEPWLKAFANAYFNAITAIRFQVAKADYLEQLANWFDDVKFAGVAVPGQDVERAERLAQIFVMPDVEEDGRRGWSGEGGRGWGDEGVPDDRQSQLLQEQRLRSQLERSGRKFSARQLLNQHQKKVVLLGAPGSGKTTLMSFFAVTLAKQQGAIAPTSNVSTQGSDRDRSQMQPDRSRIDHNAEGIDRDRSQIDRHTEGSDRDRSRMQRNPIAMYPDTEGLRPDPLALQTDADALPLPILIRIRDWARTPDVTLPEYARQFAETTMSCKPLPKGFFEHWLNNGRALILLDGLDEVAEESKRYHLVQCIENFLGQYPQNRAIITSRPAGYKRDFFRTEEFPHYELQPFDDGKIEEFCDRWYRSRIQDTAEALRRKESLQKALNQQDRIKLLARNPLLLTIIALIHRYQARLPRERYKLYDKAVETLLTAWDDNKELSNQTVLKYLQLDDLRRLMESLAYWIHTQGNTGDREGGTLIDKDELIQKLCQEIKTLKQLQHYEAKAEAERFVKFIRDRTGLLNEQGQDCYAFVHKTFQEYLAAQDINYQADNEDDFEIVLTHIEQHLHDPHWREVLLLLIAQQSPKKAARAIRKVLTANSLYEQWLHRDLLFAGRCLAEDPKGLKNADASLPLEILTLLVELETSALSKVGRKVREDSFQILCSLHETAFENEALQIVKASENHMDEVRLQQYRAELGEKEDAVKALMLLIKSPNPSVRDNSAKVLYSLSNVSETVLKELIVLLNSQSFQSLQDDEESWSYGTVAEALANPSKGSRSILQYFLPMLQDENAWKRAAAARGLASLNHNSEAVQDLLIQLLIDENETPAQKTFYAYSLKSLFGKSEKTLKAVLSLLTDKTALEYENESLHDWIFIILTVSGKEFPAIIQELQTLLESVHSKTRSWAALILDKLDYASEEITQQLEGTLESNYPTACSLSGRALFKLGKSSQVILQSLLKHTDYKADWQSSKVIETLGMLSDIPEIITQKLLKIIVEAKSQGIWDSAAKALGKLGKRSNQVEPAIVQWIEQHQDEECVGAGIDALWAIVEGEG